MNNNISKLITALVFLIFIWSLINSLSSGKIIDLFSPIVYLAVLIILIFASKGYFNNVFFLTFTFMIFIQGLILFYTYQFTPNYVDNIFYSNLGVFTVFVIIYGYMLINREKYLKKL